MDEDNSISIEAGRPTRQTKDGKMCQGQTFETFVFFHADCNEGFSVWDSYLGDPSSIIIFYLKKLCEARNKEWEVFQL